MKKGRPSFEVTDEVIAKAEKLAAQGLTLEQIALTLGICYQTLNEKRKEFSDFSEAIKRGQAKGIAQVTNKLYGKAIEGDNTAMIFYLKNRDPANWKDRVDSNINQNIEGNLTITKVERVIVKPTNTNG